MLSIARVSRTASRCVSKRCASFEACTRYTDASHPDQPAPKSTQEALDRHARYSLNTYVRPPIIMDKGKGLKLWDRQGREYLDFTAGIAVNALGHADEGVAKVLAEQSQSLIHGSNLYHTHWAGELAGVICESTIKHGGLGFETGSSSPSGSSSGLKVFLANSGTEANEGALKFARKYGRHGKASKHKIVCFGNAFHGRTFGALSATMQPKYQEPFAPLVPGFVEGELNNIAALDSLVDEDTCGVIVEPIQGEGGILDADTAFLQALRKRCDAVGAALIFDEIQCGLGRTGTLWAHSSLPVDCHPDILTMAKPLANGVPIGAILMRDRIADIVKIGDHGTTFGGGALACRVGHHVLSRIAEPSFLDSIKQRAQRLDERLNRIADLFPELVHKPRGRGLMRGLPFVAEDLPGRAAALARERGVLILTCGNATMRFVPSLTLTDDEVDHACDVLESCLLLLRGSSKMRNETP